MFLDPSPQFLRGVCHQGPISAESLVSHSESWSRSSSNVVMERRCGLVSGKASTKQGMLMQAEVISRRIQW